MSREYLWVAVVTSCTSGKVPLFGSIVGWSSRSNPQVTLCLALRSAIVHPTPKLHLGSAMGFRNATYSD
jgi:hypothetical protein